MRLDNRTVLITGGTSGIGREFAKQMLARGNTVIVTGRDEAKLAATKLALPEVHTLASDISDPGAITALHGEVLTRFPALDMLVNNAGTMRNLRMMDVRDLRNVTHEVDTNLSGPIRMIQQVLPHLISQPAALIVNVSSGLAFIPFPAAPVYCATKAAIHSFTLSLRVQLRGTGVTVVELAPPGTETPLMRGEFEREMKGQKGMDPAVLVQRALAGIEAGRVEIRPGLDNVLSFMSRAAPGLMVKQMARMTEPK